MLPDHSPASSRSSTPLSRPCLPQVEPLGDRIMLSVDNILIGGDVGSDDLLVALVMGQLPILESQLDALKLGADLVGADEALKVEFLKLTDGFLELQDAVYDFGDVLIKAESKVSLTDFNFTKSLDKATSNISDQLSKLETLAFSWGAQNKLLPAVQHIGSETMSLVKALLQVAPGGDDTHDMNLNYLKLSDDFLKISQDVIKIGSDDYIARKAGKGQIEYLKIKMEDIMVTSSKIGDLKFQDLLLGLANQTIATLDDGGGPILL